jgi:transglutaminase-like putative cysteine protease
MAVPSNIGSLPLTPAAALNGIVSRAGVLKSETTKLSARSAASTASSQDVLSYSTLIADLLDQFDTYAATPNLSTYAQAQTGNANIAADYATMRAAMVAARDWVVTNFPKSATYLLAQQIAASGRQTLRVFTAAETAGLRTLLDTLSATID